MNSHNDKLPVGLIAQLVEHCTGIAEVMGSNPVQTIHLFIIYSANPSYLVFSDSIGIGYLVRDTVQPVLNSTVLSGHPLLSGQLSKSRKLCPLINCNFDL